MIRAVLDLFWLAFGPLGRLLVGDTAKGWER
jgi:hypothetical protein